MNFKSLFKESREFVIGRITAGSTYITGGMTTASGVAKAAEKVGIAPPWLPSLTVDTVVLIVGALITMLTGIVSIWAKRQDMKNKRAERAREELETERSRRTWIMEMLRVNGDEKMVEMFGPNWRGCDRTSSKSAPPCAQSMPSLPPRAP